MIDVWSANDGTPLTQLKGHHGNIGRVAFAGDNQTLASVGDDRTVRLWLSSSAAAR